MKNFLTGRKLQIFLHILAWSVFLGFPLYSIKRWDVGTFFMWLLFINTTIDAVIFYINYFLLVPRYYFNEKKKKYFLSVSALVIVFYFVTATSNEFIIIQKGEKERIEVAREDGGRQNNPRPPNPTNLFNPPFRGSYVLNYAFTSFFLVLFSTGLRITERHAKIEKLQKELEKEKLNSELAFLKNQISPHFFFNTLNNIYSLISINAEDSQRAVLKLSKLMRYLLYESEHGNTSLSSEINFMNNYIDLMKLRVSDKINLSISFPEKYEEISIPPLLFIPFIENAFKHGISYREKSFIDISMLSVKDSITFRCVNSLITTREEVDSKNSGIGLENVKKRLNLLFPDKHELKINKSEKTFEVLLHIDFA